VFHGVYCWIECLPSTVQRRRDEKRKAEQAAFSQQWTQQQEAELARKNEMLNSITVDANGVTSVAKQIVAELGRANP